MILSASITSILTTSTSFIQSSLEESFTMLSQVGFSENKKFAWLRYWPSYLSGAIGIASTVAAIAMRALDNMGMTVFHAAIALGGIFLAGTLHIFIPMKKLEEQTSLYKQQNEALHQQNSMLQETKTRLEENTKNLSELIAKRSEEHQALTEEMNAHLGQLSTLTTQLLTTKHRQQDFKGVIDAIHEAERNLQTRSEQISSTEQNLAAKAKGVLEATTALSNASEVLARHISQLKEQHALAASEYESAQNIATSLNQLITPLQDIYKRTHATEEHIETQLSGMRDVLEELTSTSTTCAKTLQSLQQAVTQASRQSSLDLRRLGDR